MTRLNVYRVSLAMVVALLGLLGWKLLRLKWEIGDFGRAHDTWVVDLAERMKLAEARHGDDADFSETYLATEEGSVHLHALGHKQLSPMHLHPSHDEAIVVLGGTAAVSHLFHQADGGVLTGNSLDQPGTLVYSPRNTAEEWANPSTTELLFTLVFTTPKFAGHFYVKPDDARIGARMPVVVHTKTLGPAVTNTPEPFNVDGTHFYLVRVSRSWKLPATHNRPVMALVLDGKGTLEGKPLAPNFLAHVESVSRQEFKSKTDDGLSLLLFDPTGEVFAQAVSR